MEACFLPAQSRNEDAKAGAMPAFDIVDGFWSVFHCSFPGSKATGMFGRLVISGLLEIKSLPIATSHGGGSDADRIVFLCSGDGFGDCFRISERGE